MRRYIKQKDKFRCGPVALANMLKWAGVTEVKGKPVDYNLIRGYLSDITKCNRAFGTEEFDLWHGLVQLRKDTKNAFEFKKLRDILYYRLHGLLKHGYSLITTYKNEPWAGDHDCFHWYFMAGVVGDNPSYAVCVNYSKDNVIKYVNWFDTWIQVNEKSNYPEGLYPDRYYFLVKSRGDIDDLEFDLTI